MIQDSMPITGLSFRINQRESGNAVCVALKSSQQAQRFLSVHAAVYNLFNLGRTWYRLAIIGI